MNLRPDILDLSILTEKGEDSWGVFWDAMSEFWETFYLKHTDGADVKIPMTVHIMNKKNGKQWQKPLSCALGMKNTFQYKFPDTFSRSVFLIRPRRMKSFSSHFWDLYPIWIEV